MKLKIFLRECVFFFLFVTILIIGLPKWAQLLLAIGLWISIIQFELERDIKRIWKKAYFSLSCEAKENLKNWEKKVEEELKWIEAFRKKNLKLEDMVKKKEDLLRDSNGRFIKK